MTGKVELIGMHFKAYHGCLDEERRLGNEFVVDLCGEYDMEKAALSDDIADAVDYSLMYRVVREEMEIPSRLLENVAFRIKSRLLGEFPALLALSVSVAKKNPPVDGNTEWSKITV